MPFEACLEHFFAEEPITSYESPILSGRRVAATKRARMRTFPPYLAVAMQRYFVDSSWVPRKMDVDVPVPLVRKALIAHPPVCSRAFGALVRLSENISGEGVIHERTVR